jgi:hypothetical protein
MLTVSISCPSGGGENPGRSGADISISIDTSRIWGSEDLVIGEGDSGAGIFGGNCLQRLAGQGTT